LQPPPPTPTTLIRAKDSGLIDGSVNEFIFHPPLF
jgi:hypothetical protein